MADHDSFDEFFCTEYARVALFLMSLGAGKEEAEDAAQEAMIAALASWSTIRSPRAWVRSVAWRTFVSSAVRAREEPARASKGAWLNAVAADTDLWMFEDEERAVISVLRRLPPTQRLVMAWYYDGFTPTEIAEALMKPPETVRSDLRHARARLARELLMAKPSSHLLTEERLASQMSVAAKSEDVVNDQSEIDEELVAKLGSTPGTANAQLNGDDESPGLREVLAKPPEEPASSSDEPSSSIPGPAASSGGSR